MGDDKLEIICEDLTDHPHCRHGPTLLFSRSRKNSTFAEKFYACSACRSPRDCAAHIPKIKYESKRQQFSKFYPCDEEYEEAGKLREKIGLKKPSKRRYCHSCNKPFGKKHIALHSAHEDDVLTGISDDSLKQPTTFLRSNDNDKTQAQYFFSNETLAVLGEMFTKLDISKVICMGAPRLHEYLNMNFNQLKIESFLLDIDGRFLYFFDDDEFAWFNMFNYHFFAGNRQQEKFENFLKEKENTNVLLFTDPPFGCRTEPLIQTIKEIAITYKRINATNRILPVFWIFPYYMELYIKKFMPEMEMCDFKINYANHDSYSDNELGRKHGSPVRIFTNIPLNRIRLPSDYRFCPKCKRSVAMENRHCVQCKECPSKNGETYRHCKLCATCVKPNYEHCRNCGRCAQISNHVCSEYQTKLNCWICRKRGHGEIRCEQWLSELKKRGNDKEIHKIKKKNRVCLICRAVAHNEKRCPKRQEILKEWSFMGEITNIFN